jgi:hypothetical protein
MELRSTAEQLLSVEQIAKPLFLRVFTIYKFLEHKEMPANKAERLWLRTIFQVREWVDVGSTGKSSTGEKK